LIAEGRLRRLTSPDQLEIASRPGRPGATDRVRRDPGVLAENLIGAQP
jgi:hypothetical protein